MYSNRHGIACLVVTLIALAAHSANAQPCSAIRYVKAGSAGSGASWSDAYGDLQTALTEARLPGSGV